MLFVIYIYILKVDCFPNSQDQEGFEAVRHQSRDSGKFWGGLRAGELIFFPLGSLTYLHGPAQFKRKALTLTLRGWNKGKLKLVRVVSER